MENEKLLDPVHLLFSQLQELVTLAQSEDWLAMEARAIDYQKKATVLNDELYLKAIADANLIVDFKILIEQIQTQNNNLDAMVNTQREHIASELRHIMQADKAMDAYRQ